MVMRAPRIRLAQVFVSVAAVVTILALHASASSDPPTASNKSADTLATVTLPPLIHFGPLEADPTHIPHSPTTSVPTTKLPIPTDSASSAPASPDRVQACMDRCIDLHMSNGQAKANCMQSCLKQRVVPTATAAQPASGDSKDGNQVPDKSAGRGNDIWLGMLVVVLSVTVGGLAHL